jgi:ketosteroid isomerase-like protein
MNRLTPRGRGIDSPLKDRHSTALLRSAMILVALAGCLPNRHKPPIIPLRTPARDSLLLVDLQRVDTLAVRGVAATRAAYLAPDVVYLRAGAPAVFGRDNVAAFLTANSGGETPVAWQPLGGGVSRDAMSGYTFGVAIYSTVEKAPPGIARYIAFWNRLRGGAWTIVGYAELGPASPVATTLPTAGIDVPQPNRSRQARRDALEIMQADSDFADAARLFGTAPAFADAVASDGAVLMGSEVIVGPRPVREYFETQRGVSLTWHPTYSMVAASGDLGFTIGESVSTARSSSGAAAQHFGKYFTVWRKEAKGGWKFVVDGGNSRPSPVGE